MDEQTKQFIVKATIEANKPIIEQINHNFRHAVRRLDNMDKRLCAIESRLNMVQKDTNIIRLYA